MKKMLLVMFMLLAMVTTVSTAQTAGTATNYNLLGKAEAKAFEQMNKPLLKQLKTKYNAKAFQFYQTRAGEIVIEVYPKNATGKYILNDVGTPLYYEPVARWACFEGEKNRFAVSKNGKWGVVNYKGEIIIPVEYVRIYFSQAYEEGVSVETDGKGIFHLANDKVFISCSPEQVNFHDSEGAVYKTIEGSLDPLNGFYLQIGSSSFRGLYTLNGNEIYPPKYSGFEIVGTTGVVKCMTMDYGTGLVLKGAKNIKTGATKTQVPPKFMDVLWNENNQWFQVTLHRNSPPISYQPDSVYVVEYKDNGIKYWDAANYEKVIEFYEGEGYGKPWSNYYLGMAAQAIAEKEHKEMNRVISVLQGKYYYWPLAYPDDYKFNYVKCLDMYNSSIKYYEEYIKEERVPDNDPTKAQARKARGAIVTSAHEARDLYDKYTRLLSEASTKYAQNQYQIEQQRAAEAARNAELAKGITNLIGSFF